MESVYIKKDALEAAKSCGDHTASPEWDGEGLDYKDFEQTMARLAKTSRGRGRLMWLAQKDLIPRTVEEVTAFLEATPCEVFERAPRTSSKQVPPIPTGEHPPPATSSRETEPAPEA